MQKNKDFVAPNPCLIENGGTIWQATRIKGLSLAAKIEAQKTLETVVVYNQAIESNTEGAFFIPRNINIQTAKK